MIRITYIKENCKCVHYTNDALETKKFVKFIKDNGVGNISIEKYEKEINIGN